MGNVVHSDSKALSLNLSGVMSLETAEQQEAILRAKSIAKGLEIDRLRIIKAFDAKVINDQLIKAIRDRQKYIVLDLKMEHYSDEISPYYNPATAVSEQVLSELNLALKNTPFSHATFAEPADLNYLSGRRGSGVADTRALRIYIASAQAVSPESNTGFISRIKNFIANKLTTSPSKIEKYKSTFVADFQAAAQGVINASQDFKKAANANGFEFDVDVDHIAKLSSRYIELAAQSKEEYFRVPANQKMPIDAAMDLTDAMNKLSKFHSLSKEDVAVISETVESFVHALDRKIQSIESSHSMRDSIRASLVVANFQFNK